MEKLKELFEIKFKITEKFRPAWNLQDGREDAVLKRSRRVFWRKVLRKIWILILYYSIRNTAFIHPPL